MIQWHLFCSLTGTGHQEISLDACFTDCSSEAVGAGEVVGV